MTGTKLHTEGPQTSGATVKKNFVDRQAGTRDLYTPARNPHLTYCSPFRIKALI